MVHTVGLSDTAGRSGRSLSTEEHVASALGLAMFPVLAFLIMVLGRGWVWDHGELALMGLPAVFSLLTYLAARHLGTGVGFALQAAAGCGIACFLSAGAGGLLVAVISFLETF